MSLGPLAYLVTGGAAGLAGAVNALAGGGTLISFPALQAVGVGPVKANVTNIVALTPGYFAGSFAQRADLSDQVGRTRRLAFYAAGGALLGSALLVSTSPASFRVAIPFLIVLSCALLVGQEPLRTVLVRRAGAKEAPPRDPHDPSLATRFGVFLSGIYGGFFGAGLGIMLLAVLGLFSDDSLPRLNAAKQVLSLVISLLASIFLCFTGHVAWTFAAVMAVMSTLGGALGGRFVHAVNPMVLRTLVVVFGLGVAIRYWL